MLELRRKAVLKGRGLGPIFLMINLVSSKLLRGHQDVVLAIDFNEDDTILASSSQDKTLRLWNLSESQTTTLIGHGVSDWFCKVNAVVINSSLNLVASGADDQTIRLWSLLTTQEVKILTGHTQGVTCLAFHPEEKILASGSQDKTIILWSLDSGQSLLTFEGHSDTVRSLCFSPDGSLLASAGDVGDKSIKIWSLKTNDHFTLHGHSDWFGGICCVAFHPNGRLVVSGSKDKTIKIWDINQKKAVITIAEHRDTVNSVAISPDGRLLASGSRDKTVKIWNLNTNNLIATIPHPGSVEAVIFSHNGQTLASACEDRVIRLFGYLFPKQLLKL